jgi:hypothetical protein
MNVYVLKQFWFKALMGVLVVTGLGVGSLSSVNQVQAIQDAPTPTLPGVYATVTYTEPINVREGPSTVLYPRLGRLSPGDVVQALGVSPGREWVQIAYADAPGGVGWVYAIYVSISGGELHVVEAPATPTPPITATIDPTLAAAFNFQPTPSRIPTFTPPAPLTVPQFTEAAARPAGVAPGYFVISLLLLGGAGLLVSLVLRK